MQADHEVNIDKQRLGSVYARALLAATEPRQQSELVLDQLDGLIDQVLHRHPHLEATLASPRITPTDKAELLERVLRGRVSDDLLTFLQVVARRGRLDCLRQIRRAAQDELNRLRQRVRVEITTAEPLNNVLRQRILEQLQSKLGHEIALDCAVSPELLGGLVVRVGDTVFDASVAQRLARLKDDIINKTSTAMREATDRFAVSG